MNVRSKKFLKTVSLTAFFSLVAVVNLGNNCNDVAVVDEIILTTTPALDLNFQVCSEVSRCLTIRWEGSLRTPTSDAATGDTSFLVSHAVAQCPESDSPPGRSWFHDRAENLRPGEWDIEVEYIMNGIGYDIRDRIEFAESSSVYFTHRNDDASTTGPHACP